VQAVNDPPTFTTASPYSGTEDGSITLSGIVVADIDAADNPMQATLTSRHGDLALPSSCSTTASQPSHRLTTLTSSQGRTVDFTATLAVLNNCLPIVVLTLDANYAGKDFREVTLRVDDLGSGLGSASSLVATGYMTAEVSAVNDPPVAVGPTLLTTPLERGRQMRLQGFQVEDVDVDATWGGLLRVTITVAGSTTTTSCCTVSLPISNGLHFTTGTGGDGAQYEFYEFEGSVGSINTSLKQLYLRAKTGMEYCDQQSTIVVGFNDQGNTGSGGALSVSLTRTIGITCNSELTGT